jgi:hypothetical protein
MEIITSSSLYKGAVYPFLMGLAWIIFSLDIFEDTDEQGSIGWVRSDKFAILQLKNTATGKIMNMDAALHTMKLTVNPGSKTMPTVSKRLSRIMRPYYMSAFIPADRIKIQYNPDLNAIMDGAGVVTRKFLRSISLRLVAGLEQQKRKEMLRELKHGHRLELTIMTDRGQDKGHVYVTDEDFDFDVLLPADTKGEVKYTGGDVFIGLAPVHGSNRLWIDSQSIVNLHPFFTHTQLLAWLKDYMTEYVGAILRGDVPALMGSINGIRDTAKIAEWPIREYLVSKGNAHPMDSAAIAMAMVRTLIKEVRENSNDQAISLPIPGMRRYLFSAAVRGLHLKSGECLIQGESIFVSNRDYVSLAKTLGGADQDDAILIHQFVDTDGIRKALCWRNPNQYGEYVVLIPTPDSDGQTWLGGEYYPNLDSSKLPTSIAKQNLKSLNKVQPSKALVGLPYSWPSLHKTVGVMRGNAGALGATCNLFMAQVATFGKMFSEIPDYLEKVIDSTVKTGDDTSEVLAWVTEVIRDWADNGVAVPKNILPRVNKSLLKNQSLPIQQDSWFDELYIGVNQHIEWLRNEATALCNGIMPPATVMAAGTPWTTQGAALREQYWRDYNSLFENGISAFKSATVARTKAEATLERYGALAPYIVLGAITHCYLKRNDKAAPDEWLWQQGSKVDGKRTTGIGNITVQAFRVAGHIGTPRLYAGRMHIEPVEKAETPSLPVQFSYPWFNAMADKPARPGMVDKELADELKAKVAATDWRGTVVEIRKENNRVLAYHNGSVFAYINASTEAPIANVTMARITATTVIDGNILASIIPVAA